MIVDASLKMHDKKNGIDENDGDTRQIAWASEQWPIALNALKYDTFIAL